jgi:DNA topoisomerase I
MKDKMKKLLIVESPTKARTIGKYLGGEYKVLATVGHIRDLPSNKMAVDFKNFNVDYVIDGKKKRVVDELIRASKSADQVFLASDPDREGEAISWHVKWILLNSKKPIKENIISRVTFHEITKDAIKEALKKSKKIDMNLVNSQQGRRVLDRVVGYSLSPILWKKVRRGLSAGRVQSVAVRLICEREKEIEAFKKEKYFSIYSEVKKGGKKFNAELIKVDGNNVYKKEKLELFDGSYTFTSSIFKTQNDTESYIKKIEKEFLVDKVLEREARRSPLPAFTTSKLQQMASRKMGWSGKQTMSVAQKLYEKGLITYHRTDSVYLSEKSILGFRKYIEEKFGANYVVPEIRFYKNTSKNAQEAHEAIRPTNVSKSFSDGDNREGKLYEMIWKRAVATQGAAAVMKNTKILFTNGNGIFESKGVRMLFDGFLKITGEKHEDQVLPELKENEKIKGNKNWFVESETNPMPRYSDASLVSSLEKQGIGRPSTYAPIISTILLRQYVEKEEGKFKPTVLGQATNEFLVKNFANVLSLPFTAEMEKDLDEVAFGKMGWKDMMKVFWKQFEKELKIAESESDRVKVVAEKLGKKCPECKKGELVIRLGRFGKFISCDQFPECKYTRQFQEKAEFKCPECGSEAVIKKTKSGRKFFGCSTYPKCKWAGWKKP